MNFIILGDKYQKGMKSKGCSGLIKTDKKNTLFDTQYAAISCRSDVDNIVYVCGFESKKIENFIDKKYSDVVLINNQNHEESNDAYSLSLVADYLTKPCFIVSGYAHLNTKIIKKIPYNDESKIFVSNKDIGQLGCVLQNNRVTHIGFDLPNKIDDMYYISSGDANTIRGLVSKPKYHNYFLFELLNILIDSHNTTIKPYFHSYKINNYEFTK